MPSNQAARLHGKVVLVTGGASGIGAAVVARLRAEGATPIIADLAANPAEDALAMDVADPHSVAAGMAALLERHGRIDGLVNSAGIGRDIPFLDTPLDVFDRVIAVNLRGSFIVGQAAARAMAQSGGGAIVNIASVSGLRGNRGRAAYGASKGGVVLLSQVMAVDLAPHRIRVNAVAPGPVETPLVAQVHTAEIREDWLAQVPLRRYGTPDEIAAACAFLLSEDAAYVTGHVLAVDGGFAGAGIVARAEPAPGQG